MLDAEDAHHLTLSSLKKGQNLGLIRPKAPVRKNPTQCFGIEFPNRIGLAAGLDKDGECIWAWSHMGFGFVEVGTVTPKPQVGNPRPRLFRLKSDKAIINRMGFNNRGVDYLVERLKYQKLVSPIGVNIGKNKDTALNLAHEDYLHCFEKVYQLASYVTVNISSPNTPDLKSLQHGDLLKSILVPLKEKQAHFADKFQKYVPIVVKISPDLNKDEIQQIVQTLLELKIDGVIATNTTVTRPNTLKSKFKAETGGLSGAPLFHQSNLVIQTVSEIAKSALPIIAVGGVMCASDALKKFELGAQLVQIYTGMIYKGPKLIRECIEISNLRQKNVEP